MEPISKEAAEEFARIAHEVNRGYCQAIGDNTQMAWESAPQWQKDSAIKGVWFQVRNPDAPPSASHDSWLKEKTEQGWKFGLEKNPELKEHPCFVPYEQLPIGQQIKDHLFKAVVRSLVTSNTIVVMEG